LLFAPVLGTVPALFPVFAVQQLYGDGHAFFSAFFETFF
jgi:hypothetical protein